MKSTPILIQLLCMMFIFSACTPLAEKSTLTPERSTSVLEGSVQPMITPTAIKNLSDPIVTQISVENTPTIQLPYCKNNESWIQIWPIRNYHDYPDDYGYWGPLFEIEEGPDNEFWFLYGMKLVHYIDEDQANNYDFEDLIECSECDKESNGTIAVTQDGTAWVGFADGVLVVDRYGAARFIPLAEILPEAEEASGLWVLLDDREGKVWINGSEGSLCSTDGVVWKCEYTEELIETYRIGNREDEQVHIIASAVLGEGDQIWFGTKYGRIIQYKQGTYTVYELGEISPSLPSIREIGAMAFDEQTGTLWAVGTAPPLCTEGINTETSGVISRSAAGEWKAFGKNLFRTGRGDLCFWTLSTIAVMPDSRVWLGMNRRQGLVYYDGEFWWTLNGKTLPDLNEKVYSVCDFVVDVISTQDGRLLVGNIPGIFYYKDAQE